MKRGLITVIGIVLLLLGLVILINRDAIWKPVSNKESGKSTVVFEAKPRTLSDREKHLLHGKAMAKAHCSGCHVFPDSDVLNKRAWRSTLYRMRAYLGFVPAQSMLVTDPEGFDKILNAGVFPTEAAMDLETWKAIVDYYLQTCELPAPPTRVTYPVQDLFEPEVLVTAFDAQCLQLGLNKEGLWVSHEGSNILHLRDPAGKWRMLQPGGSPSQWRNFNGGKVATLIGSLPPSFKSTGAIIHWKNERFTPLMGSLHRPTDILPVDLNADGREDLVVCEYGCLIGNIFWLENTGNGFKRHTLMEKVSCLNVQTTDLNNDNYPDLIFLAAEAREAVHLFLSTGPGTFERRTILERHPAWGHTHIEVLDFDSDGHQDLLITNGDNGEYEYSPYKSYHGIRLHLNDGQNNFKEAFFHHQPGAYKALARDFDGDGDLDIASIAYFPDFQQNPRSGFVLLRQDEPLQFSASNLASAEGRWITMDSGDWDGDGDIDIVLGAHNYGPQMETVPAQLTQKWEFRPVPLLLLRNKTK